MADEPQPKTPWHRNVNGVWIPTAFAVAIAGTLVEVGRLIETIHDVQKGQASTALSFSAEHDSINRRIGDVEHVLEDIKTMQAVDNEHTRQQDVRIDNLEKRK
jgi:hypothetical protein